MAMGAYILGRGLACTLGVGVAACLENMRQDASRAQRIHSAPDLSWPYFSIPGFPGAASGVSWHERARDLVRRVVAECGADICREAPLFIASSSLNVGGLEEGAPFPLDEQAFVEEVATWLDWRGPVFWVSSACTSSLNAMLSAKALIESGLFEQALVLGMELRNQFTAAGFSGMQLLAPDVPRPLDIGRNGLVLGKRWALLYKSQRAGARRRKPDQRRQSSGCRPARRA
jgi:3-oxoacyl-[acyl-carrier-protein] synthase-1